MYAQVQHRYFLLVVLTCGVGDDLAPFEEALRQAGADLALSVVVIGVGGADFRPLQVWTPYLACLLYEVAVEWCP